MLEEQQVANATKVIDQQQPQRHKGEVVIVEQPASKKFRFRYKCEGRSAGSIPGANSTSEVKTFPTIQVQNYVGDAIVVVSCVTKDPPYKPHPHNLVGKEGCGNGIFTLPITSADMKMVFSNLGIQCVKKNEIEKSLMARQQIHVDPFRTGFSHATHPSTIDLNVVRLCFQVFLPDEVEKRYRIPLRPVVSQPIYDKKSSTELVVSKLSHSSALCTGGQEVILLCEKIVKDDISIRFYEEDWEGFGAFHFSSVHKQVAISFRTPRYKTVNLIEPVIVKVQLRRPSDGAVSESLDFEMLPVKGAMFDLNEMKRKQLKTSVEASSLNIMLPPQRQIDNKQFKAQLLVNDSYKNQQPATVYTSYQVKATPQPQSFSLLTTVQPQTTIQQHHLLGHQINQYQQHHLQGHQINQFQSDNQQWYGNNNSQAQQINFHQENYSTQKIQAQDTNDQATSRNRQETSKILEEFSDNPQNSQMISTIFSNDPMLSTQTQNFNGVKTLNLAYCNELELTTLSGDLATMLSVAPDFDTFYDDQQKLS